MKICKYFILLVCGLITFSPDTARAWLRAHYLDPVVVQRAELIVVAHIEEGSIVYFPHAAPRNGGGASWEYHGVLVVTEQLKGQPSAHEIPIIIHYGLTPVTGGYVKTEYMMLDQRVSQPNYPTDVIEIFDTASFGGAITGDIRQDHLWFLRVHNWYKDTLSERDDTTTAPGIWDPEDVQPLELKPYFQAFLTDHPIPEIEKLALEHSPIGARSQVYLNHLKIKAALKEPDLSKRAEILLPFFLFTDKKDVGPTQHEASVNLSLFCGQAGAAVLVPIFNDPKYEAMHPDIMLAWSNIKYYEATPLLIDLLRTENHFWTLQMPVEKDLWSETNADHSLSEAQKSSEQRIESALQVLRQIPDIHAKPVVEETRRLWTEMQIKGISNNVTSYCDDTLVSIQKTEERTQN